MVFWGDNDYTLSQMKSQILFNSADDVWRDITGTFCPLQSLGLETCHRKKGEFFFAAGFVFGY